MKLFKKRIHKIKCNISEEENSFVFLLIAVYISHIINLRPAKNKTNLTKKFVCMTLLYVHNIDIVDILFNQYITFIYNVE